MFASPGYMLSHHTLYLEMTYDDGDVKPGATIPVSFRAVPAGADCFLKSGGGAIAEAKWRVGCALWALGYEASQRGDADEGNAPIEARMLGLS